MVITVTLETPGQLPKHFQADNTLPICDQFVKWSGVRSHSAFLQKTIRCCYVLEALALQIEPMSSIATRDVCVYACMQVCVCICIQYPYLYLYVHVCMCICVSLCAQLCSVYLSILSVCLSETSKVSLLQGYW